MHQTHRNLSLRSVIDRYQSQTGTSSTAEFFSASRDLVAQRFGSQNPAHRAQIASHVDAQTPFFAYRQDALLGGQGGRCVVNYHTTNGVQDFPATETFTGVLPFDNVLNFVDSSLDASARNLVCAKVYKLLAKRQTAFEGGVFLGELRETLKMIRNPARGLSDFIRGTQFRRYNRAASQLRRNKRSASKAVADLWLEASFGWRPFMNDIEQGLQARQKIITRPNFKPFEVSATAQSVVIGQDTVGSHSRLTWNRFSTTKRKTTWKVYGETNTKINGVMGQLGLSPRNFVPTVWELLPYSFLVDYFSNIGDVLSAMSVDLSALTRASVSKRLFCDTTTVFYGFRPSAFPDIDGVSGGFPPVTLRDKIVDRPGPGFSLSVPRVSLSLPGRTNQWYNMGALIRGQYRGSLRF